MSKRRGFFNPFRFADRTFNLLGKVVTLLATPHGISFIDFNLHVVLAGIPSLLGMDVFDRVSLTADTVQNR